MATKYLVLDANILVRATLGTRVRQLLKAYTETVTFYSPDVCLEEARKYVPALSAKRNLDPATGMATLNELVRIVEFVEPSIYGVYETQALSRIRSRDAEDWPILATSLLLNCPIWTEDRDFFGTGAATWTTANVEIYLRGE